MTPAPDEARPPAPPSTFEQLADRRSPGVVREMGAFLLHNKKWWLTPIVLAILLVGAMLVLGASGAAPFIYTLF